MLRPSSLPALEECPCFESGLASEFAEAGTDRHTALAALLHNRDSKILELLPDEEAEGVKWAVEYILLHANHSEHPITTERGLTLTYGDFDEKEMPGTPDVTCHLDLFDLKWRQRDYTAQMCAYVLMQLQALGIDATITVHILYGAFQKAEVLKIDRETAERTVFPIIARYEDPQKQPAPCTYCGWCAHKVTCSALNQRAQAVAAGREDWNLETYHASQITNPVEMGKALNLARGLSKWIEAVEHFAKEMAIKQGQQIPGYTLAQKSGKRSCADIAGAFGSLGLTADKFLACCDVRFTKSKADPNKLGLEEIYAEAKGITKAAAKRELKTKLEPFFRTPKEITYLKAEKSTDDDTEQNGN